MAQLCVHPIEASYSGRINITPIVLSGKRTCFPTLHLPFFRSLPLHLPSSSPSSSPNKEGKKVDKEERSRGSYSSNGEKEAERDYVITEIRVSFFRRGNRHDADRSRIRPTYAVLMLRAPTEGRGGGGNVCFRGEGEERARGEDQGGRKGGLPRFSKGGKGWAPC